MNAGRAARRLCRLEDIPDGGARGFDLGDGPGVFVVRRGARVWGYLNDCPHWRLSLDFLPGRFVIPRVGQVQCANHGARFRVEDGLCVSGPCRGERLQAVGLCIVAGEVVVEDAVGEPRGGGRPPALFG